MCYGFIFLGNDELFGLFDFEYLSTMVYYFVFFKELLLQKYDDIKNKCKLNSDQL